MEYLRMGNDAMWTDDNMRGRLSELEYVKGIPETMLQEAKIIESKNRDKELRDASTRDSK